MERRGKGKYILYKAVIPRNENVHLAPDWNKADVTQHLKYALAAIYLLFIFVRPKFLPLIQTFCKILQSKTNRL